jgi:hypothetical protein
MGVTAVVALIQYLKVRSPAKQEEVREVEQQIPEIKVEPAETYICINTVDLEEITQILTTFKKRFHVMQGRP